MVDGALNLLLDNTAAARLEALAEQAGMSPTELAKRMLDRLLENPEGAVIPEVHPSDFDGPYVELDEALNAFSTELHRRLASKAA